MFPGFLPQLACRLQIYVIWCYENVSYFIESFRGGRKLWIVLKHKPSSNCTIPQIFFFWYSLLWMRKRKLNKLAWETESFIHSMKIINFIHYKIHSLRVYIISLYRTLELIAMNELGKVWFQSVYYVKFHGCSERNFKSLKQLFLNWFSITAFNVWTWMNNFKYQILNFPNKKLVTKNRYIFQQFWFVIKEKIEVKKKYWSR